VRQFVHDAPRLGLLVARVEEARRHGDVDGLGEIGGEAVLPQPIDRGMVLHRGEGAVVPVEENADLAQTFDLVRRHDGNDPGEAGAEQGNGLPSLLSPLALQKAHIDEHGPALDLAGLVTTGLVVGMEGGKKRQGAENGEESGGHGDESDRRTGFAQASPLECSKRTHVDAPVHIHYFDVSTKTPTE